MKVFHSFQKNAAHLGIELKQIEKGHPFNVKNVMYLILIGSACISNIFFLCSTTNSIGDNMYSLYMASMTTGVFLVYAIVVWKMESLFKFIKGIGKAMDSSKNGKNFK